MRKPKDWRTAQHYDDLRALDAPGFAWEFLRRNPDFQTEKARLTEASDRGALDLAEADAFTLRWGYPFEVDTDDTRADARTIPWTARALPSVTLTTTAIETGADSKLALSAAAQARIPNDVGASFPTLGREVFRVTLVERGVLPPTVLLPLDELFEIRAVTAIRLWRALHDRPPSDNPAKLTRQRIDRLILALRALDGKLDGATHRQIAAGLFPRIEIPDRGWISHDLRDRTARLVRLGSTLMTGGYKRLLLQPYRRIRKG